MTARKHHLRVIAGSARGRRLVAPPGFDVRPTKDRVREAMFSALDARDALVDVAVLDLYAGSGALGIEALSRGAARAVFVEDDPAAAAAITDNLATTGYRDVARVDRHRVEAFVATPPPEAPFGLVCCDPPYDLVDASLASVLTALAGRGWLADDAWVTVERGRGAVVTAPTGLTVAWNRTFGDTLVVFLHR